MLPGTRAGHRRRGRSMNLGEGELGNTYTIRSIVCDAPGAQRMMHLGLLPGSSVKIVQVAPLGDPMTVETETGVLSLRRQDARALDVDPLDRP